MCLLLKLVYSIQRTGKEKHTNPHVHGLGVLVRVTGDIEIMAYMRSCSFDRVVLICYLNADFLEIS